jgi:hypothetical protein
MRAHVLVAVLISACDRPNESAVQAKVSFDAGAADASVIADASVASVSSARAKKSVARIAEPTMCGQHPDQPGCNCFTDHPNSTCSDP